MKVLNILKRVLLENQTSKFNFLYQKYSSEKDKNKLPFKIIKSLILTDPTTRKQEGLNYETMTPKEFDSNVKAGKYSEWIIKKYMNPEIKGLEDYEVGSGAYRSQIAEYQRQFLEDLDTLKSDLLKYDRFKDRLPSELKQIQNLSIEQLSDAVSEFKLSKASMSKKEEEIIKKNPFVFPGSELIYEDSKWAVVKISEKNKLGKDAACYFGGYYDTDDAFDESNWCTSNPTGTYFEGYLEEGPLYIFYDKQDTKTGKKTGLPKNRYQLHFASSQFKNRRNKDVDFVEFLSKAAPEIKGVFKEYFISDITFNSEDIHVQFPDSAGSKFIRLYGVNEFFNMLPKTIEGLHLYNSSTKDITIKIPATIGKFENLTTLRINKLINSIPDEICNLKNLELLNLNDNAKLKSIPDCLVNNKSLIFIALEDTSAKISAKLASVFEADGNSKMYVSNKIEI